jgi:hypothetical protein
MRKMMKQLKRSHAEHGVSRVAAESLSRLAVPTIALAVSVSTSTYQEFF